MEFPIINFDHDSENFIHSIGMDETQFEVARYTILYEMLSVMVLSNLDIEIEHGGTKSAVLERSMLHFTDQPKQLFMTILTFESVYDETQKQMEFVNDITNNVKKKIDPDDPESFIQIMRVKANNLDDAFKHIKLVVQTEKLMSAIKFLKDSNCDYNKFIDYTVHEKGRSELLGIKDEDEDIEKPEKKTRKKSSTSSDFSDIDDLIRKAFMNKDKDED